MNKNKKIKTAVVYARVSTKDAKPSSSTLLETLIKNGMAQHYSLQKGIQIRAGIRAKKLANMNNNSNAVIYQRTASIHQDESTSPTNQESVCREYCKLKGIIVKKLFSDQGVSGINPKKSSLYRLVKFCKRTKPQFVIVTDVQRISRDIKVFNAISEQLSKVGTIIRPVNDTN